jgi:hypothetical protein
VEELAEEAYAAYMFENALSPFEDDAMPIKAANTGFCRSLFETKVS